MYSVLIKKLDKISGKASGNKFQRLIINPFKYLLAIGHRALIYPVTQKAINKTAKLFWGDELLVALPSGVDMYILGAKADDSEIRLSKYLINTLKSGDTFIDVGAHFGYYSILASRLVGVVGKVIAFEPSNLAFELLNKNTSPHPNIKIHNTLIGSHSGEVIFYEFPTKYAEYNSMLIDQYKNTDWFDENLVTESKRGTTAMDEIVRESKIDFIKIDVEGAEYKVLLGAKQLIISNYPVVSMEYVHADRSNEAHKSAAEYLRVLGYQSCVINQSGELEIEDDLDRSLLIRQLQSDNFIFIPK